jgi:hypothetical protein
MKYGDDDDTAVIRGQVSSLSVYTLDTVGTTRTSTSIANVGSVTTTKTSATSKSTRQRLLSNTLRKKFGRKDSLGVNTNNTNPRVLTGDDNGYYDAESRDADNFDEQSATNTIGTSKSRRHSMPSLSFGYSKRQQRGGGSRRPDSVKENPTEGTPEDPLPESFGSVPPSSNKNSHTQRLKKMLSPKMISSAITSSKEPVVSSAPTSPAKKKYYLTKTSISQHSLYVNSNHGPYEDNSDDAEGLDNDKAFAQSLLEKEKQKDGAHVRRHQRSRTEEAIECIFSTLSFRDPNESQQQPSEQHSQQSGSTMSSSGGGASGEGNSEERPSSSQHDAEFGSFFYFCGDPNRVLEDGGEESNKKVNDATTTTTASSLWPFGRLTAQEEKIKNKPERTIVHVTDIVSQKRDFTVFLKAYEELLQTSKQQESLRDLAAGDAIPRSISMGSNTDRLCTFCPKSRTCVLPPPPPATCWPQYPICLRATPGTGMRVIGVRFSSSNSYLDSPCWWKSLGMPNPPGLSDLEGAASTSASSTSSSRPLCDMCQLLPINSGFEAKGKALVIDFESDLFVGTLVMRVRNARPLTFGTSKADYFAKANRKYQAAIRGEFKSPVASNRAVTGQVFPHEVVSLPSKFLLKTAVSVFSVFAPQLQANFDGNALDGVNGPSFISPLASTPQAVVVQALGKGGDAGDLDVSSFLYRRYADASLDGALEEPVADSPESIMAEHKLQQQAKLGTTGACSSKSEAESSASGRAKARKKYFDKQFSQGPDDDSCHTFQPGKIYTFEFLQHLVNFDTYTLDVGTSLNLNETLNGQPLKFMGASLDRSTADGGSKTSGANNKPIAKLSNLWSFDIWHEGLLQDANAYAELERAQKGGAKASASKSKKK